MCLHNPTSSDRLKHNSHIRQPRHSFSTLAHRETFVLEQQVAFLGKTQGVFAQRPGCTLRTPGLWWRDVTIPGQWTTCTTPFPPVRQCRQETKTYAHIEANLLRCSGNFPKPRILQPTKDFQRLSESRLGIPQLSLDLCRGQMVTLEDPGETVLQCAITLEIRQTLNNARHSLIPGFPIRSKMHFLTN